MSFLRSLSELAVDNYAERGKEAYVNARVLLIVLKTWDSLYVRQQTVGYTKGYRLFDR